MFFRKKIQRSCSYCQFGAKLEGGQLLCSKNGMRTIDESCRKFKYDPLKRVPAKEKAMDFSKYKQEDFSL